MALNQAQIDLNAKLRLERAFLPEVNAELKKVVQKFVSLYALTGIVIDVTQFTEDFRTMFFKQYKRVGSVFDKTLSPGLPADVAETDEERSAIAGALGVFYLARSEDQARIVTRTNARQLNESVADAFRFQQQKPPDARSPTDMTNRVIARLAGAFASRKFSIRARSITTTETQTIAEIAKSTEADVLLLRNPLIQGGDSTPTQAEKLWRSVGDQRVRESHMNADGQVQLVGQPFRVGDSSMMFPGDSNLGAPLKEIVNCRCTVVFDEDAIADTRRLIGRTVAAA